MKRRRPARRGRGTHDAIAAWWSRGSPWAFQNPRGRGRVGAAFRRVLGRLSPFELQKFLRARPRLLCEPFSRGEVFFYRSVRPLTILCLGARVLTLSEEHLRDLLAHEIAHIVLGHPGYPPTSRREQAADARVKRWGFTPAYTSDMIRTWRRSERARA